MLGGRRLGHGLSRRGRWLVPLRIPGPGCIAGVLDGLGHGPGVRDTRQDNAGPAAAGDPELDRPGAEERVQGPDVHADVLDVVEADGAGVEADRPAHPYDAFVGEGVRRVVVGPARGAQEMERTTAPPPAAATGSDGVGAGPVTVPTTPRTNAAMGPATKATMKASPRTLPAIPTTYQALFWGLPGPDQRLVVPEEVIDRGTAGPTTVGPRGLPGLRPRAGGPSWVLRHGGSAPGTIRPGDQAPWARCSAFFRAPSRVSMTS